MPNPLPARSIKVGTSGRFGIVLLTALTTKANDLAPDMYLRWLFQTLPNTDLSNPDTIRAILPYGVEPDIIVQSLADHAVG